MSYKSLEEVKREVIRCRLCERLVRYRESVEPRAAYRNQDYWRRPVPGYGDPDARLIVIGLAPAAHGGNRTGRIFTGDESGRFLVRCLYKAGYANQPRSESRDDGLLLYDCYLTAAVKCAPPNNKPTRDEFDRCSLYLNSELDLLKNARSVLALGKSAFDSFIKYARGKGAKVRGIRFRHGKSYKLDGLPRLYASYHPSPRNTYTGKLTEDMLVSLLRRIRRELE